VSAHRPQSRAEIAAEGLVPAPPEEVFEFLADLANHWKVADRFVEVVELEGSSGGWVRVRGPLGLRRSARTTVTVADPPRFMAGTAELGGATRARVTWSLAPAGEGTRVRLEARLDRAGALDRLLLRAGGSAWLTRRFRGTLENLAARFAAGARGRLDRTVPAPAARW